MLTDLERELLDAVREGLKAAGCKVRRTPGGLRASRDGKRVGEYRADLCQFFVPPGNYPTPSPEVKAAVSHIIGVPGVRIVWVAGNVPPLRRSLTEKPEPKPQPRATRETVNGKPLKASQARYPLRLTGRRWAQHEKPPTREEATELIQLLLAALRDPADNMKTKAAVDRVSLWYPDFERKDVRRWECGKAKPGQGRKRKATVRAASRVRPRPKLPELPDRGPESILAADARLSTIREEAI